MQLPKQLPTNEADRNILGEFYNLYNSAQWFERAEIVEDHPTLMKKTLEVTVRYNPLLEAKEILGFVHKYNLALSTVVIRND